MEPNRYLIVGLGPVGQVFGAHLVEAEIDVSLWTKPSQAEKFKNRAIQIQNYGRHADRLVEHPKIVTEISQVDQNKKHVVFLCVQSTKIPTTFHQIETLPNDWPIVFFSAGFKDGSILQERFPQKHFIHGYPGFSAFQDGNLIQNKITKLMPTMMEDLKKPADDPLIDSILADIEKSSLPTKKMANIQAQLYPIFAYGMVVLLGAEYHGWHFLALAQDKRLMKKIVAGGKEAADVVIHHFQITPTRWQRLILKFPPSFIRFMTQVFLGAGDSHQARMWSIHAKKIREQTHQMVDLLLSCKSREQVEFVLEKPLQALFGKGRKGFFLSAGHAAITGVQ